MDFAIDADISALKKRASFFITQRRKDVDLYQVLADCMALCERARDTGDLPRLQAEFLKSEQARGKRAYFERDADEYLIVGRYVFEPEVNRAACWRYVATMREAAKRQISASQLVEWLRGQGGINALFKTRPVAARTASTKTLHLTSAVTVPKDGPFTLTLRREPNGFFCVVAEPTNE
jgi:hypothetical protein